MTREENLHWINEEIRTWENECQSKHPIKEALYAAQKALEQEPFMNKLCISSKVCEHDKEVVLDKIRAEIVRKHLSIAEKNDFDNGRTYGYEEVLEIIDKYKTESEKYVNFADDLIPIMDVVESEYIEIENPSEL